MPALNHDRDKSSITNVMRISGPITCVINTDTIAERVKIAREEANLRQEELARRAGVSQGTIGNLEGGLRKNPRELLAIAKALGVNAEWLKSGKGPKHPEPAGSGAGLLQDETTTPYKLQRDTRNGIEHHVTQIGAMLTGLDEVRRGAIAELLSSLARYPEQADEIGRHIAALATAKAKKAA